MARRALPVHQICVFVVALGFGMSCASSVSSTVTDDRPNARAPLAFTGAAWGSTVKVDPPYVGSGKSAYVSLGCTRQDDKTVTDALPAHQVPELADIGDVSSTISSGSEGASTYTSTGLSTVSGASVQGGRIVVGAINALVTATSDIDGYHAALDLTISILTVDGVEVELTGGEQVIEVPGLAEITVAKQKLKELPQRSKAKVTAVKIELFESGAVVKLGQARAGTDGRAINAVFTGASYGTKVTVADEVTSGRSAVKSFPCVGTSGEDLVKDRDLVKLGPVGKAEDLVSTVNAVQLPLPEATATSTIGHLALVDGRVVIDGVTAVAHVTQNADGTVELDTSGTLITTLTVDGVPVELPEEGGEVVLAGIGTLTYRAVTVLDGGDGVEMIAAQLHEDATDTDVVICRAAATIGGYKPAAPST